MSVDLYWRRLTWRTGYGGVAKEGDVKLVLHTPPAVFPNAAEVDLGEVHRGVLAYEPYVREHEGGRRRDMTAPEVIAVRAWLSGLLTAVMRAATRPPAQEERRR